MPSLSAAAIRLIVMALAVILLVLAIVLGVHSCDKRRAANAQNKVTQAQTGAVLQSGADASNTQATVSANDLATANLDQKNAKEIRDAKGSDATVDPAAQSAGLRALCRRAAYRNRPECRVQ